MLFIRTAFGPNTRAGLEIIRVVEVAGELGPVLVRTRAPFMPDPDVARLSYFDPVSLVRAPYRVSFSYAGPDRVWRNTWRNADTLPRAIRLRVRDAATDRILAVSTATTVHAELPADCIAAEVLADCIEGRKKQAADGANATPSPPRPRP